MTSAIMIIAVGMIMLERANQYRPKLAAVLIQTRADPVGESQTIFEHFSARLIRSVTRISCERLVSLSLLPRDSQRAQLVW
jgi:hypothetical protein